MRPSCWVDWEGRPELANYAEHVRREWCAQRERRLPLRRVRHGEGPCVKQGPPSRQLTKALLEGQQASFTAIIAIVGDWGA